MKRIIFVLVSLSVILLQSCSKDSNPVNNSDTGINNANSYFPLVNGSTWFYNSRGLGQFTNKVVGDSTVAGIAYKKIEAKTGSNPNVAYSCVRGVGSGANMPKADPNGVIRDVVFVKDGLKIGDTWTYKSNDSNQESFYEYNCTQVGIEKVVQAKTYSDVICVESVIGFNFQGRRIVAGTLTTYYAKGIGMIEQTSMSSSGSSDVVQLISYTK
jgi:hypothetical protein